VFHVSICLGLGFVWGAKPTKAPHGDGTVGNIQPDHMHRMESMVCKAIEIFALNRKNWCVFFLQKSNFPKAFEKAVAEKRRL